jgi:hypothetical protein
MCGLTYVTVAALCCSCSLQKYLERWPAALNEAGRSVSVVMKWPAINESRTPYTSLVNALFTVYAQQTPVYLTSGLLRVCATCPTPRLNLRFEHRPSWKNFHDTFPTGTAQDTTIWSKICIGLHVKYPLFFSGFNEIWNFSTDFLKMPKCEI